jgi:hypothetical protein
LRRHKIKDGFLKNLSIASKTKRFEVNNGKRRPVAGDFDPSNPKNCIFRPYLSQMLTG